MANGTRFTALRTVATLVVGSILTVGGYATYQFVEQGSGEYTVTQNFVTYYSGSLLPIEESLSLTEVAGQASGTLVIRNPYDTTLLCDLPTVRVTTAAAPTTKVDIYTATGGIASNTSSGVNLADNFTLSTLRVSTLTGAGLTGLDGPGAARRFILYPYSAAATGQPNRIILHSRHATGASLAGSIYVPCYALD